MTQPTETPKAKLRIIVDCPNKDCGDKELEIVDLPYGQNVDRTVTCSWCETEIRVPPIWVKS